MFSLAFLNSAGALMTKATTTARSVSSIFLLVSLVLSSTLVRAADQPSSAAVARAHNFLKSEKRGKYILSYVHFGARYDDHNYIDIRGVTTRNGKTAEGHFALVYRLEWDGDGRTDIAFLCDTKGNVYDSQVLDHNGVVQQPYLIANATIQVLGNLILDAFKDQLTEADRKTIQTLIDNADAEGLMEFGLKFQQALE